MWEELAGHSPDAAATIQMGENCQASSHTSLKEAEVILLKSEVMKWHNTFENREKLSF